MMFTTTFDSRPVAVKLYDLTQLPQGSEAMCNQIKELGFFYTIGLINDERFEKLLHDKVDTFSVPRCAVDPKVPLTINVEWINDEGRIAYYADWRETSPENRKKLVFSPRIRAGKKFSSAPYNLTEEQCKVFEKAFLRMQAAFNGDETVELSSLASDELRQLSENDGTILPKLAIFLGREELNIYLGLEMSARFGEISDAIKKGDISVVEAINFSDKMMRSGEYLTETAKRIIDQCITGVVNNGTSAANPLGKTIIDYFVDAVNAADIAPCQRDKLLATVNDLRSQTQDPEVIVRMLELSASTKDLAAKARELMAAAIAAQTDPTGQNTPPAGQGSGQGAPTQPPANSGNANGINTTAYETALLKEIIGEARLESMLENHGLADLWPTVKQAITEESTKSDDDPSKIKRIGNLGDVLCLWCNHPELGQLPACLDALHDECIKKAANRGEGQG